MKTKIVRYLKHIFFTILVLAAIVIPFGLYHGASLHYGDHELMYHLDKEGPYVFYENDSTLSINHIRGNKNEGFYLDTKKSSVDSNNTTSCYFQIDSSNFNFKINPEITIPNTTYNDDEPILAISDIEGGYKTFRDFLIHNKVIDKKLNWTFGKGHLVLLGDFVDRGWSVTQVLWFIYKLEQDASKQGGVVHFIIGNHELKNMQGHYQSSAEKYYAVAAILKKQHHELYNTNSVLGRWMASKNTMELINGNLFVHGGIHPDVAATKLNLNQINQIIRKMYYKTYYPSTEKTDEQLLNSNRTGIAWYRGYFKDDLTQKQIESGLSKFNAKAVIVGHTLQSKVNRQYNGKVIGIDVKHPKDYQKNWPFKKSEGLLIVKDTYYRIVHDGTKEKI